MRSKVFLIFDARGVRSMSKRAPALKSGEYAVAITVNVPDKFFARAIPEAELTIPENAIREPTVDVDVAEIEVDE